MSGETVMARVEVVDPALRSRIVGLNVGGNTSEGTLVAVRFTMPVNPFIGVREMLDVLEPPGSRIGMSGEAEIVKSGLGLQEGDDWAWAGGSAKTINQRSIASKRIFLLRRMASKRFPVISNMGDREI